MNKQILQEIKKGNLTLFLGAGASYGCTTSGGAPVPGAIDLAKLIASEAGMKYEDESLDVVYEAGREQLGKRLDQLLENSFRHVTPSSQYNTIASYVWRRIYTLNIDDGLDFALAKHSQQKVNKLASKDPVIEKDVFFQKLEYIKLNGTADRLQDGIIFSPSEYARGTNEHLPWYSQCGSDFVRTPMLFIGTQLNEPLLKFHIERYQALNHGSHGISYVIAKSATEIQIRSLKKYKIEFIQGKIEDFASWLQEELPSPPTVNEIAQENIPQLRGLMAASKPSEFANLFEHVIPVRRDTLPVPSVTDDSTIKAFYKGFKPSWDDIVRGVPAQLEVFDSSISLLENLHATQTTRLLPILGPAGSGKTTLLMQLCLHFSGDPVRQVFFINSEPTSLLETLIAIEETAKHAKEVIVAIDNIEFSTEHLAHALKSLRLKKTLVIGAEREGTWNRRGKHTLKDLYFEPVLVREFTSEDAKKILAQLQKYGSWTRLGKMSEKNRIRELVEKSKKQLLIALMEATLGRGFQEIIEGEYAAISSQEEKLFLVTIALATDRRCDAPVSLVDRALDKMSILRNATAFADDLAGIIHMNYGKLSARHPVYAKYLIDRVIDPTLAAKAINGLLQAFADYKAPVIQNIPKSEAVLYKSLINHTFLYETLKGHEDRIIQTYRKLEKKFESDGLFWLQYGLALRDFHDHPGALEKLKIACSAYPMPHTLHALGQQLLLTAAHTEMAQIAIGLADEAKQILEKLDDIIESDDTYPVVTLAEGYTEVLRRHGTAAEARSTANRYALLLENRSKRNPGHDRLRMAYERLFKFATLGIWQN
ncbi:hypothetical protein EJO66_09550 [Variovorax beijingensis]|uniref:Novel STAND NTPase 5 domain-containing protein n=1 Tax=Variovorax beijingensis TaxID=2496117 RepID=A0ABY0A9A9_9BURK|nr:SIR2 family protein [Variovorax beijingensis]RSZ38624.1 hypothetical protein EJO66_09550 [Variovorax beijingensis]